MASRCEETVLINLTCGAGELRSAPSEPHRFAKFFELSLRCCETKDPRTILLLPHWAQCIHGLLSLSPLSPLCRGHVPAYPPCIPPGPCGARPLVGQSARRRDSPRAASAPPSFGCGAARPRLDPLQILVTCDPYPSTSRLVRQDLGARPLLLAGRAGGSREAAGGTQQRLRTLVKTTRLLRGYCDDEATAAAARIFHLYLPLYFWCLGRARQAPTGRAVGIGISAPQGCGKTTLVDTLVGRFAADGLVCAAASFDDFYLTHEAQRELAAAHPTNRLLELRGNAGTRLVSLSLPLSPLSSLSLTPPPSLHTHSLLLPISPRPLQAHTMWPSALRRCARCLIARQSWP